VPGRGLPGPPGTFRRCDPGPLSGRITNFKLEAPPPNGGADTIAMIPKVAPGGMPKVALGPDPMQGGGNLPKAGAPLSLKHSPGLTTVVIPTTVARAAGETKQNT